MRGGVKLEPTRANWGQFIPTTAYNGTYFRTQMWCHQADTEQTICSFLEAVEHPLTNEWQVSEVTIKPNVQIAGENAPEKTEESRILPAGKRLSLKDAIEKLAEYEISQIPLGYIVTGPSGDEIGDEYYANFIRKESAVLDVRGKLHPVVNGRIVTEGYFPEGTRDAIKSVRQEFPEKNADKMSDKAHLSHLFTTSAQVDDITRLFDRKKDVGQWVDVMDDIKLALSNFDEMHSRGFHFIQEKSKFHIKTRKMNGYEDFIKNLRDADSKAKKLAFLSPQHVEKISNFVSELELSFEVSYAKHLFRSTDTAEEQEKFKVQLKRAQDICRKLGGSEIDVKSVNAEVVSGKKHGCIKKKIYENENHYPHISKNYGDTFGHYTEHYYFPTSLLETLEWTGEVKQHLEQLVEQEKIRIENAVSEKSKADTANSTNSNEPSRKLG